MKSELARVQGEAEKNLRELIDLSAQAGLNPGTPSFPSERVVNLPESKELAQLRMRVKHLQQLHAQQTVRQEKNKLTNESQQALQVGPACVAFELLGGRLVFGAESANLSLVAGSGSGTRHQLPGHQFPVRASCGIEHGPRCSLTVLIGVP